MRKPLLALVAALCLSPAAFAFEFSGRVVDVHDGDTLTVLVDGKQVKVRLVDIDAPELGQAFGKKSRQSLAELCWTQLARVRDRGQDRYGRIIGQVTCDGIDANAEQVRRGMAWVFVNYAPADSPLYRLQTKALMRRIGLWTEPRPLSPWEWRRNRRVVAINR
jgi:endonuclease YncB( thermonuclease family)